MLLACFNKIITLLACSLQDDHTISMLLAWCAMLLAWC